MKTLKIFLSSILIFSSSLIFNIQDVKAKNTFSSKSSSITFTEDLDYYNKYIGQKMLDTINQGKLKTPDYIKNYITELSENGYCRFGSSKAYLSKPLIDLIYSLVTSNQVTKKAPFSILSLFRKGRNHGAVESNGIVICRAIDIDIYSGYRININNPYESLKGIIKIINNMPEGSYNIGLPRPGGGKLIDPSKDFFLPVTSLSQNEKSPTGSLFGDLKLIKNDEARELTSMAILKNKKAQILYLMPDAVDHVHIKALDNGKLF